MNRIISILSLVIIVGGLGYTYYTGLLMQLIDPQVQVVSAKQNLLEDQRLRSANLEVTSVSVSDVAAGVMVFPDGMSQQEVASSLEGTVASHPVDKGAILTMNDVRRVEGVFVLRVIRNIDKGEPVERSNVLVTLEVGDVPDGAVVFGSEQAALEKYLEEEVLTASRELEEGSVIMVDDVSGGNGAVFVLSSARSFDSGSYLSLQDVNIEQRPTREIPRGAVSFPTREAAEIFISTSGGINISRGLEGGEVLVVSSIARTGGSSLTDGEIPTTLKEYLDYEAKYPGRTIFVDEKILVGSEPIEGESVDLWIETESTNGPFGVVKIKRIKDDAMVFRVTNTVQTEDGEEIDFLHWAEIGLKANSAIDEARAESRMAFMVNDSTNITDFIGNGSVCRDDVCSVSKNISDNLRTVRLAFAADGELIEEVEEDTNDPLRIMEGVDGELERRMISAGYTTFREVATWEEGQIKVISFNLEITDNLAYFIRQQAINIISNPERARQELGMTNGAIIVE